MRYFWLCLVYVNLALLLAACGGNSHNREAKAFGNGRLLQWSEQNTDAHKKVIFIHGYGDTNNPHGLTLPQMESFFSPKIENLDYLGDELFGFNTSELVEFWFYGYQPEQDLSKIADDLAELISNNSRFDNSQVAVVGYSQGGVVAWLLDQRYPELITGGVTLGAPILSTPLAHKSVRDRAICQVLPLAGGRIVAAFDALSSGTEHLMVAYPESNQPKTQLMFFAGLIEPPSTDIITRNINLLDALTASHNFLTGIRDNRQFGEIGATIINVSGWGNCPSDNCPSDGIVPVSSTWRGHQDSVRVWSDYDHWDLLSGKGDFNLDRAILRHLGDVLDLWPIFVEGDLPETPIIELSQDHSDAWGWIKFAYVRRSAESAELCVTDEDWRREIAVPISGNHSYPQFGPVNDNSLVWTVERLNTTDIYVWHNQSIRQISYDNQSRYANFSPNGEWLAYQSRNALIVHNLENDQRSVVVNNVQLTMPPIWISHGLHGRIYFIVNDSLYWVSPRCRGKSLANAACVMAECHQIFLAKGMLNGVVAVHNEVNSIGQIVNQKIVVVSGLFSSDISVELQRVESGYSISGSTDDIIVGLDWDFRFDSIIFDQEYGHLYLADNSGLYILDINSVLQASDNTSWNDVFYLIRSGITQPDIRNIR